MTATATDLLDPKRSVLGRAFDILECFSGSTEQSISGLCNHTGLPPATVHRMLANLVEWGAVERAGRGRYRLGRRLWRLGNDVPSSRNLKDTARPCQVDLHSMTGEIAVLASADADRVVVADVIAGRIAFRTWTAPRQLPMLESAPGLVLLANLPYDAARALVDSDRDDFKLRQQFSDIRRNGVAVVRESAMVWVSAPVFDETGAVRSTMSAVVPADRLNLPAVTRVVSGAARAVSDELHRRAASVG
ncbi:MAG: IclR family transcriptional regulator [Microthrixaceae bacterium]